MNAKVIILMKIKNKKKFLMRIGKVYLLRAVSACLFFLLSVFFTLLPSLSTSLDARPVDGSGGLEDSDGTFVINNCLP